MQKYLMRQIDGFSLVELLVTIAILGIVAGLAVPTLSSTLADQRLSSAANALLADLNFLRSESLRRGVNVSACPSSTSTASTATCSGNNWQVGWIVFIDSNGDGDRGSTEEIVRANTELTGLTSANSTSGGSSINFVRFNSRGLAPFQTQNIALTNGNADFDRTICIASTGRPRIVKASTC